MARYYQNPDSDRNPEMTQGNVVMAIRDRGAEELPERQRFPRAVSDIKFCNYIEYLFIVCGRQDRFKRHPEYKPGIEIRCENRDEATYLDQMMWSRYKTVVKYSVAYLS